MKRRISSNPKPPLSKDKRKRQRELDGIRERGYAKIAAFWARIGVKVGA